MADEEVLKLTIDARPAKEGAKEYTRSIDDVEKASDKAAATTADLEKRFKALAVGVAGAATLAFARLSKGMGGFAGIARTMGGFLADFTAIGLGGLARGLRGASDTMRDANGEMTGLGSAAGVAAKGLDGLSKASTLVGAAIFGLQAIAVVAAVKLTSMFVGATLGAAREFAPAMNRVRTLVRGTEEDFELLSDATSSLAGTIGVDGVEAADALYQTLSAMPELANDTAAAMSILEASLRVSRTGFASAEEAASSITGILNAFNLEASHATDVSDALYTAQALGVTTFGEIAGSIDRVAGLASSLGVEYTDLLAIVSTATSRLATDTNVAMTQLRAIMGNILRPSTEAARAANELGVEFSAAAVEAQGLNNFLIDLIEVTEGRPDVLARFFGSQEALALVVGLSNNTQRLTADMEAFADAQAESARVAEIMNNSYQEQKDLLGNQMQDVLRQLGAEFERVDTQMLKLVNAGIEKWREWRDEIEQTKLEWEAMAQSIGQEIQTFALPPMMAQGPQAGGAGGIVDPTGLDVAAQKINELGQAHKAAAVQAFAATGDLSAYRDALSRSEEAVNRLVLAEAERNRLAGETPAVINAILDLFNAETTAARELEAALLKLDDALKGVRATMATMDSSRLGMSLDPVSVNRPARSVRPGGSVITAADVQAFTDTMRAVNEITSAFGDLANALDELSPALADALSGIEAMAAGAGRFRAGQAQSGMLGTLAQVSGALSIAAGAFQIASTFFGDSEADKERQRAIEGNTDALRRLSDSLTDSLTRGDMQAGVDAIDFVQSMTTGRGIGLAFRENEELLRSLASEHGITGLLDAAGDVDMTVLQQLEDAIRMSIDALFEFGGSLRDQTQAANTWLELNDLTGDRNAVLGSQFGLLEKFAPELLKEFGLSNLDLTSETGREVLNNAINEIFDQYLAGTLDKDLLAGFQSGQEFVNMLLGTDSALDAFKEGLEDATRAVTDIPKAINIALYRQRFGSGVPGGGGSGGSGGGGITVPPSGVPGGTGGPQGPMGPRFNVQGNVIIQTDASESGEQVLRKVERAVQDRNSRGAPTLFPGVRTNV